MRNAFLKSLLQVAREDKRVFLVVGDLGFGVVEPFAKEFPDRFINAGVAEQNMTGLAAGLALSGKIVYTYSIANFPTLRCLEQIRNDVCYHHANVKIVAVGGGFAYGALGVTHYGVEDLSILRTLPGMTVIAPGDPWEAASATSAIASWEGPCYLRLNRNGEIIIHKDPTGFQIGKAILARGGHDITLICTGGMLETTVRAADKLEKKGISSRVLSMHTLKPFDEESVLTAAREGCSILTVEEHSRTGGLGSAVAEVLAESGLTVAFKRIGADDSYLTKIGSQEYMRKLYGLTVEGIVEQSGLLIRESKKSIKEENNGKKGSFRGSAHAIFKAGS